MDDGTLTITADLAYDEQFDEPTTARQVADLPRLFLATSALKPDEQTLLVDGHRQLATISDVD